MVLPSRFGAVPHGTGTRFSLWAEGRGSAAVEVEGRGRFPMKAAGDGWFTADLADVGEGARYWFSLDDGPLLPDLASRWQPEGHDGPSVVVGDDFPWTDHTWAGVPHQDQVLYELHLGTFTPEGTWQAAAEKLEWLRELGVTILQVMPVNTFKGRFGWGYDTTLMYSPYAPYGTPHDMRAFVDRAHRLGLGVILDVVYNHVGTGAHFESYSPHWFTSRYENEWGESFNFDGDHAGPVREFIAGNAAYWIESFHLDGLRIDAAQALFDASDEHIVTAISRAARAAGGKRRIYLDVENQPQERRMIEPLGEGGHDLDAMYNDDFHHTVRVATTGHNDFYYRDYAGTAQEIVSALKYGFLYQGQHSDMRQEAYGTPNLDTPAEHFIHFLENHDQVANSARGFRLAAVMSPARLRAATALLLLGPQTPMLFQGQEWASTRPFLYFLGLDGAEAQSVSDGRRKDLSQFPGVADPEMQKRLPEPADPRTFEMSKLDWTEAERHAPVVALHRDLLHRRREDPSFSHRAERRIDGAVLGEAAILLRFITPEAAGQRLLLVNLGRDLPVGVVAEPLLAPPRGHKWQLAWSSEHPDYDGAGQRPYDPAGYWVLPGDCAMLLEAVPR